MWEMYHGAGVPDRAVLPIGGVWCFQAFLPLARGRGVPIERYVWSCMVTSELFFCGMLCTDVAEVSSGGGGAGGQQGV